MAKAQVTGEVLALGYYRVSSDEQAREGVSPEAQKAECRRYVEQRGWVLWHEYLDIMTGKKDERPQYQAMLSEVRRLVAEGRRVVVVVAVLDRFGRRLRERLERRDELKDLGVAVHSVREGGEVNELMANFLAVMAEEEVRRLGERVAASRQHFRSNGWNLPGRVAWGYRLRDATPVEDRAGAPNKVLDIDEATAPSVRELFRMVAEGASVRAAVAWALQLPEEARGGRRLSYRAIYLTLSTPVYVSRHKDGSADALSSPVCRWPALIDDATWEKVQKKLAASAMLPRETNGEFLLPGIIKCSDCGRGMVGKRAGGRNGRRYVCAGTVTKSCAATASADQIDEIVLGEVGIFVGAVASPGGSRLLRAVVRDRLREFPPEPSELEKAREVGRLERRLEEIEEERSRASGLFVRDKLPEEEYHRFLAETDRERIQARGKLETLRQATPRRGEKDVEYVLANAKQWAQTLATGTTAEKRKVLALFAGQVLPHRIRRGEYDAEVRWTPLGDLLHTLNDPAWQLEHLHGESSKQPTARPSKVLPFRPRKAEVVG